MTSPKKKEKQRVPAACYAFPERKQAVRCSVLGDDDYRLSGLYGDASLD
jgi:hypothetical protein